MYTVYPPKLQPNIFTFAAIDNIDHNATSSTASNHFHGTSISLFQHPPGTLEKKDIPLKIKKSSGALSLPNYYTNVKPAPKCKCESPIMLTNECDNHNGYYPLEQMQQWFNRIDLVFSSDSKMPVSWSAFFEEQSNLPQAKCISSLLPLLKDNINSPAVVMHSMKIIQKAISVLNPNQTPVITADQPVYAISKNIQWKYPNIYGEDKFVVMMGALHIEMATLKMIGNWLTGSEWADLLVSAGIYTVCTAESLLTASHLKRVRYSHQITAASLRLLLMEAYG